MPFAEHDGARIYWSALGRGEPLVLIMGLGCSSALWFRLAPRLARDYRVILIDNRGVGQTVVEPSAVHRVSTMAGDVAAVLDAAGEKSAHVFGLSMGGMIAQQFALDHPARVRSLLLAATNCGGPQAILAQPEVRQLLFSKSDMTREESLRAWRAYTYARQTPDSVIEEDHQVRLANFPTLEGYLAQLHGLIEWSSFEFLPRLQCPALVLHGAEDQLVPPQNGRLLAAAIPGAELIEMERASHWVHTDQPEQTVAAMNAFIRSAPAGASP